MIETIIEYWITDKNKQECLCELKIKGEYSKKESLIELIDLDFHISIVSSTIITTENVVKYKISEIKYE